MTRMAQIGERVVKACSAAVVLVSVSSPALGECVSVGQWRDATVKGSPAFDVGQAEQASPELLAFITNAYNRTPPESSLAPDAVFLLMSRVKGSGMPFGDVMFGMFKGGCLVATFVVPLPHGRPSMGEPV